MNNKRQVWLPLLISLSMIVGMYLGFEMRGNMPGKKFFSIDKRHPLQEIVDLIENKYVDDIKLNQLTDTAIAAILSKLDPHSVYIPAEKLESVNEELDGQFFGIGIEYNIYNDTINVTSVFPDGPSFKAGLKTGDRIIKVNDSIVAGVKITTDKVRKFLRGGMGSSVTLTFFRGVEKKSVVIERDIIPMTSIDASYMIDKTIGYIKLNKFAQPTYREFMQSLEALQKKGMTKLILDLRDNGGGLLDKATSIADEFLAGDKLITYTEGKHLPRKEFRCNRPGLFEQGELVVLADEGTASASEVLIGALQDWDRATIIGRRTFGKGLVQEQYDLSDNSALRLTVARYYTPIGRSIQRPYTNGGKAYYDEINNRFHDGEVMTADSIKNDTTKKYTTLKGKTVYGGGGITPDIFVALDTAGYSNQTSKLYMKGTISDFAYRYYLQNEAKLKTYKTVSDFSNSFSLSESDWKLFDETASKDSISLNNISATEKAGISDRIKASIARQVWRNEGFFEVLNTNDNVIKKALEVLRTK